MRAEICRIVPFCGFAALTFFCGLLAWMQLTAVWPGVAEKIDRFRRQPPLAKAALLVFVVGFVAYGSTKTNQAGGRLLASGRGSASRFSVTPEDVSRGWRRRLPELVFWQIGMEDSDRMV